MIWLQSQYTAVAAHTSNWFPFLVIVYDAAYSPQLVWYCNWLELSLSFSHVHSFASKFTIRFVRCVKITVFMAFIMMFIFRFGFVVFHSVETKGTFESIVALACNCCVCAHSSTQHWIIVCYWHINRSTRFKENILLTVCGSKIWKYVLMSHQIFWAYIEL